jgi:hypothetical protein
LGARNAAAEAPRVAVAEATDAARAATEARQHKLAPMHEGDRRTFTITGRDGRADTAATLTERVTSLRLSGDVLRAEIAATWITTGGRSMTEGGYSARRVEEVDRDGLVRATNRLDRAPIQGSEIQGVALPRRLEVGRSWSVLLTYQERGREVTARIQQRVAGKVQRRAPDGRVLEGVMVEWSEARTVAGAKRAERWTGTSVYLVGVGELETRMKRTGSGTWYLRKLASFDPGR